MASLDTLDLSVRTEHILRDRCGVTTTEELASLHILRAMAERLGRLGAQEIREAQLRLAGSSENAIVTRDAIFEAARGRIDPESVQELGRRFEDSGWKSAAPGRWRQWLRDVAAVNEARLEPGPELLALKLVQTEGDGDIGLVLVLEPARTMAELVDRVIALGDGLQMKRLSAVSDALLPEISRSWCDTRGGYIPLTPLAGAG